MKTNGEFEPAVAAKKLLREGRSAALATLMAGSGDPYCSLVNVATAADGAPRVDFELAGGKKASVKVGARNPPQTAVYVQTDSSPRVLLVGLNVQYYSDLLYAAGAKAAVASSSSDPSIQKN